MAMMYFLQQVFSLLTTNPGSLAYNLVLVFALLAALLAVVLLSHSELSPRSIKISPQRMLVGLGLLLGLRFLLFLAAALAWQQTLQVVTLLPTLERGVDLLSLLLITWLWAFPYRSPAADLGMLSLGVWLAALISLALGFTLIQDLGASYNGSMLDALFQLGAILICLAGGVLLLVRRTAFWFIGVVMLSLLFTGHLVQLAAPLVGSYPGPVRLAQMVAFPLLIALPYRFVPRLSQDESINRTTSQDQAPLSGLDVLQQTWLKEPDPSQAGSVLCDWLRREFDAQVCALLVLTDNQDSILVYQLLERTQAQSLSEVVLPSSDAPLIQDALWQGQALRLNLPTHLPDLSRLQQVLNLHEAGSLLSVPLQINEEQVRAQLMLLGQPGRAAWQQADQMRLQDLAQVAGPLLCHSIQCLRLQEELHQVRFQLGQVQERVEKVELDRENLIKLVAILQQAQTGAVDLPAGEASTVGRVVPLSQEAHE